MQLKRAQQQVREFHEKHGFTVNETPTVPSAELAAERLRIMDEEYLEMKVGLHAGDLVQIADGMADLIYTVLGTAVACGIDLHPIFEEVQRSNMTKEAMDPTTKKGGKGPNFSPADVRRLLMAQLAPGEALASDYSRANHRGRIRVGADA